VTPDFARALELAEALPAEDRRLLVRELSDAFSPADRWTLIRGLVAVEPAEDLPGVLNGRSVAEVADVWLRMLEHFDEVVVAPLFVQAFSAISHEARERVAQLLYREGRRLREEQRG
jgi:hypothetical protein